VLAEREMGRRGMMRGERLRVRKKVLFYGVVGVTVGSLPLAFSFAGEMEVGGIGCRGKGGR
jgi:hypothetical protein